MCPIHWKDEPRRAEVYDSNDEWLATMTQGAYTVTLTGPERTFSEPNVQPSISHSVWVRTFPTPFYDQVDRPWLTNALKANEWDVPDVLSISMQYVKVAPAIFEGSIRIGGDASYGPLDDGGTRQEGSDFNDYLGIEWEYTNGIDKPESNQKSCLDCSGFMRMIWGYRHHLSVFRYPDTIPLCRKPAQGCIGIPRRARQMYETGPGVIIAPDRGAQVSELSTLSVGDIVFFDAATDDGTAIDHVGMFMGIDTEGSYRFISSRERANGPTLGDLGGKSVLDGTELYARSFRAVRRF